MTKMIKLFQAKADRALAEFTHYADKQTLYAEDSAEAHFNEKVTIAFKIEAKTWQAAADLLRKELMNA